MWRLFKWIQKLSKQQPEIQFFESWELFEILSILLRSIAMGNKSHRWESFWERQSSQKYFSWSKFLQQPFIAISISLTGWFVHDPYQLFSFIILFWILNLLIFQNPVLYNGSRDGCIRTCDVRTLGSNWPVLCLRQGELASITCLRVLRNENHLLASGLDGSVSCWKYRHA